MLNLHAKAPLFSTIVTPETELNSSKLTNTRTLNTNKSCIFILSQKHTFNFNIYTPNPLSVSATKIINVVQAQIN